MFNSYDSSDENTSIVEGIRETFMEIDKYEMDSARGKNKKQLGIFRKPTLKENGNKDSGSGNNGKK